ncbi:ccr4 associated factor [Verticillium nonalfalfae]|uniref:Iron-sulfur cluster assembly factor IBA57 homolog, mitochondrial n=1 Tax=Verticillium nonalfalfae TaxID=1051616 RepID=A0A3M9Y9P2_9PEZI|nr:ccr4 associated factor [Verticillium nonalfalfae]RNJ57237.1 ccr4 associated factor [Verticillium nonalfalfae]
MRPLLRSAAPASSASRLLPRRPFSSSACRSALPPPPPPAAYAPLPSRRLISVSGPDTAKFLQGVITANINAPGPLYAAFLTATGRILNDVFIYPDTLAIGAGAPETSFLIEADADQAPVLAKHIRRYKLRAKFDVRLLDDSDARVWHLWNDAAPDPPAQSTAAGDLMPDRRAPGMGYRLVRKGDAAPALDLEQVDEQAYTLRRYLRGVAEGQGEMLREHALPQESNLDYMGGIEYHKGCYVGQELTIRTKHRGVVRKRILPCVLYNEGDAMPTELAYRDEGVDAGVIPCEAKIESCSKRARNPGKWLSGIGNLGLALCRLETLTDLAGPLPTSSYQPTDEFKVEWTAGDATNSLKVKAFVPDWLRQSLEAVPPRNAT